MPEQALPLIDAFEEVHGRFDFVPSHRGDHQDGAYYLDSVDAMGVSGSMHSMLQVECP